MKNVKQIDGARQHRNLLKQLDAARVQQDALVESLAAHEERLAVLEANLAANPNGAKPKQDAELGRTRRELKCAEKNVMDGQLAFCRLAEEETVARFALADERWRAARVEIGKFEEQAVSLGARQESARKRLEAREAEHAELAGVGRGLVGGPLTDYVHNQAEAAVVQVNRVRRDLHGVEEEQATLSQRLTDCRRELGEQEKIRQEILAAGKSNLCELKGSLDQIKAQLGGSRVTVDRRAVHDILAKLPLGVDGAHMYYWRDTGEITACLIHRGRGPDGVKKVDIGFDNHQFRMNLEAKRSKEQTTTEKALVGA